MNARTNNKILRKFFIIKIILIFIILSSCGYVLDDAYNGVSENEQEKILEIGHTIRFGNYYWIILDIYSDNTILVITENVIFEMPHYQEFFADVTWENSDIRRFLNNDFLNIFTEEERNNIVPRNNHTPNNEWFILNRGGNDTVDYVFLLSIGEVIKYFGDSGELTHPTPPPPGSVRQQWHLYDKYNSNRMALNLDGIPTSWWLRSPGFDLDFAAFVMHDGSIMIAGQGVNQYEGVRPVLLLRYEDFK